MMESVPLNVLGVSGSMSETSQSASALRLALEAVTANGGSIRLLDLSIADLPMFRPGVRCEHPAVQQAIADVLWADAFILSTPDYHGSMSGAIKNFLDYHWQALAGKLFGYLCSSQEKGLLPMEQMRTAVRQCYGWSLPYGVAVSGEDQAMSTAERQRLTMLGRDLVVYGKLLRQQFKLDLTGTAADTFTARYR